MNRVKTVAPAMRDLGCIIVSAFQVSKVKTVLMVSKSFNDLIFRIEELG